LLLGPDRWTAGKDQKTHGAEELDQPGDELPDFDTRHGKIDIPICFDRQLSETVRTSASMIPIGQSEPVSIVRGEPPELSSIRVSPSEALF
jgi:hypothetical protein